MTDTNIRQAILAAADHIEANPGLFDFSQLRVPLDRTAPACALGWIGHFAGITRCRHFPDDPTETPAIDQAADAIVSSAEEDKSTQFYQRLNLIDVGWILPRRAPDALRAYADRYHPETKGVSPELTAELDRIFAGVTA